MNKYPVLFISLKDVEALNYHYAYLKFLVEIKKIKKRPADQKIKRDNSACVFNLLL